MIAVMTKEVPKTAVSAIPLMFDQLWASTPPNPSDFDWAIHPGGAAILRGAQQNLNLEDDHIRASIEVYQSHGNSSSPTVLIVLDRLRHMGKGRDDVVATSFGPGMMIEMCLLKRNRKSGTAGLPQPRSVKSHIPELFWKPKMVGLWGWLTKANLISGLTKRRSRAVEL